jgi:2-aminoadipate transaminase
VAYEVAHDGFLDVHIKSIRQIYRQRRDVMLESLQEFFPPGVTWTRPQGGLFLWVTLPKGFDSAQILEAALRQNVAFVPGTSFYANAGEDAQRHMRLNFSNASPEQIREGICRLSLAVQSQMCLSYV